MARPLSPTGQVVADPILVALGTTFYVTRSRWRRAMDAATNAALPSGFRFFKRFASGWASGGIVLLSLVFVGAGVASVIVGLVHLLK